MEATIKTTGQIVKIKRTQKEDIGGGTLYQLEDLKGKKVWNGNFTWFPKSFLSFQ